MDEKIISQVYSVGQVLIGVGLILLLSGCGGKVAGISIGESDQQKFDYGMTELLSEPGSGPALRVYEGKKEDAFRYAQQVCEFYDKGGEGIAFDGTEFGNYLSYEKTDAEIKFVAAIPNTAVHILCPENRSSLPY